MGIKTKVNSIVLLCVGLAITLAGVSFASSAVAGETARRVIVRSNVSSRNCYSYRQNFLQQAYHAPHQDINYGQYLVGESLRINAIAVKLADAVEAEFRRRRKRPLPDDETTSPDTPDTPSVNPENDHGLQPVTESFNKLIQTSCVSCHSGSESKKGFSLDNLENLSSLERQAMFGAVVTGYMPFKQAPLTDEEVKLFENFTKKAQSDE